MTIQGPEFGDKSEARPVEIPPAELQVPTDGQHWLDLTVPAHSLRHANAMHGTISEELHKLATAYGEQRARLDAEQADISQSAREVAAAVRSVIRNVPTGDLDARQWFTRQVDEAIDEARLSGMQDVIMKLGIDSGLAQGRIFDSKVVDSINAVVQAYRERNADLFHRYHDLEKKSETLFSRAVDLGIDKRYYAEKDAIVCSKALGIVPSRYPQIESILSTCDEAKFRLVEKAFYERYETSLKERISASYNLPVIRLLRVARLLPQAEAKRARLLHLVERDHIGAAADSLAIMTGDKFKRFVAAYSDVMRPANKAEVQQIETTFRTRYPLLAPKFDERVQALSGIQKVRFEAARSGNTNLDDAIAIHEVLSAKIPPWRRATDLITHGSSTRTQGKAVTTILEAGDPVEIARQYLARFGVPLALQISNRLADSGRKDRALATLRGDEPAHEAAVLRCAFNSHDGVKLGALFLGKDEATRTRRIAEYNAQYGNFWESFRTSLNKIDRNFLTPIIMTGTLNREETIYRCVVRIGADEKGVLRCLKGLSSEQIGELEQNYKGLIQARFGRPGQLLKRLRWELASGDSRYDLEMALKGAPKDFGEQVQRLRSQLVYERSGTWFKRTDIITQEGATMERDVDVAERYYREHVAGKEPSPEAARRLQTLCRFALRDFTTFRAVKNDLANLISNVGTTIVGFTTFFAILKFGSVPHIMNGPHAGQIAHTFGYFSKVASGVLVSGMFGRFTCKYVLKGPSYGREEVVKDFALSCIEAGSMLFSGFLSGDIARRVVNIGAKVGIKQLISFPGKLDDARHPAYSLSTKNLQRTLLADDCSYRNWFEDEDES